MEHMNVPAAGEAVDFSLHKLTHILKGTACVSEDADPINETINTLVHLALDQVEETREHLNEVHKHHFATEKETEKPAAPSPQPDAPC
jgi:hypothetical protein